MAVTLLLAATGGDEAVLPMFIAARSAPICSMRLVRTYHASIYGCNNGRGGSRASARCAPSVRTTRLFMDVHVGDRDLVDGPREVELLGLGLDPRGCEALFGGAVRGQFVKNSRHDVHRHITTIQIASARLGRREKTLSKRTIGEEREDS
jgi:hypothetical protein